MMPGYAQQHSPFPPALESVPAEARLPETFAFTPGALAAGAVLGLAGWLITLGSRGATSLEDLYVPAGCVAGALLFGIWEVFRRLGRTVVAFHGDQIGVYRSGKLVDVAYRSQIMVYQLSVINTVRELVAFGMLGMMALGGGAMTVARDLGMGLIFLGVGIGLSGAFVSSIYARIACRHFFVPKGKSTEQVMFTRGAAGRFHL